MQVQPRSLPAAFSYFPRVAQRSAVDGCDAMVEIWGIGSHSVADNAEFANKTPMGIVDYTKVPQCARKKVSPLEAIPV
jgi:hypothetical protein